MTACFHLPGVTCSNCATAPATPPTCKHGMWPWGCTACKSEQIAAEFWKGLEELARGVNELLGQPSAQMDAVAQALGAADHSSALVRLGQVLGERDRLRALVRELVDADVALRTDSGWTCPLCLAHAARTRDVDHKADCWHVRARAALEAR